MARRHAAGPAVGGGVMSDFNSLRCSFAPSCPCDRCNRDTTIADEARAKYDQLVSEHDALGEAYNLRAQVTEARRVATRMFKHANPKDIRGFLDWDDCEAILKSWPAEAGGRE